MPLNVPWFTFCSFVAPHHPFAATPDRDRPRLLRHFPKRNSPKRSVLCTLRSTQDQ